MTAPQEIVDRLRDVGVVEDEARVYVALLLQGPSRAGELAHELRQSRPKTYRALEGLVGAGFAVSSLERPARFEAAPLESVFADLRSRLTKRLSQLDGLALRLREEVDTVRAGQPQRAPGFRFSLVRGREEIARLVQRLYETAREEIRVLFVHPGNVDMLGYFAGLDVLESKARAGVKVRVAVDSKPPTQERVKPILALPNVEARRADAPGPIGVVLVDQQELVAVVHADGLLSPKGGESIAVWSNARELVLNQRLLFERIWEKSPPIRG